MATLDKYLKSFVIMPIRRQTAFWDFTDHPHRRPGGTYHRLRIPRLPTYPPANGLRPTEQPASVPEARGSARFAPGYVDSLPRCGVVPVVHREGGQGARPQAAHATSPIGEAVSLWTHRGNRGRRRPLSPACPHTHRQTAFGLSGSSPACRGRAHRPICPWRCGQPTPAAV